MGLNLRGTGKRRWIWPKYIIWNSQITNEFFNERSILEICANRVYFWRKIVELTKWEKDFGQKEITCVNVRTFKEAVCARGFQLQSWSLFWECPRVRGKQRKWKEIVRVRLEGHLLCSTLKWRSKCVWNTAEMNLTYEYSPEGFKGGNICSCWILFKVWLFKCIGLHHLFLR